MPESPVQAPGRVHASYRRSNGAWSAPVCRGNSQLARHYADHVDGWLRREAKWEFSPCDCPGARP